MPALPQAAIAGVRPAASVMKSAQPCLFTSTRRPSYALVKWWLYRQADSQVPSFGPSTPNPVVRRTSPHAHGSPLGWRTGSYAAASEEPLLTGFTFDHVLNGVVVGCRRDNKQLFAIRVVDNVVIEEVIHPADPRFLDYPPLPYEGAIDRDLPPSQQRRRLRVIPEPSA